MENDIPNVYHKNENCRLFIAKNGIYYNKSVEMKERTSKQQGYYCSFIEKIINP